MAKKRKMAKEMISKKTQYEFREFFVGTSIGHVDDTFHMAGIKANEAHQPTVSGARRGRVEQCYASVDFTKWHDVKRILVVYAHVLDALEHQQKHGDDSRKKYASEELDLLLRCVRRDGYVWSDGKLTPVSQASNLRDIQEAVSTLHAPELMRQLERLRQSVDEDPGLAIGTAKEMLETACKTILEDAQVEVKREWDVPDLLKETRKLLKLLPEDVPEATRGAETIKKILGGLGQIGYGLAELRNLYGSGHGRSAHSKGLSERHARLAVGTVATLVQFLFDTHRERKLKGSPNE